MSIEFMAAAWKHGPDDKGELLVLLALADYANSEGVCWPAMKTIAQKARMSERNARRVVRKLESGGVLKTLVKPGRMKGNTYQILRFWENRTPCPVYENKTGHLEQENRTSATLKPDIAMSAEPLRTKKETHARACEAVSAQRDPPSLPADSGQADRSEEVQNIIKQLNERAKNGAKGIERRIDVNRASHA